MFLFLSKLLTRAVSPVMIVCELLVIALIVERQKPRLSRVMEIAALLFLMLAGNRWFGMVLAHPLEEHGLPDAPVPNVQAIVVLSSNAEPPVPPQPTVTLDDATANRLLYGAELYRAGKAPVVILSGGQMPWTKDRPPMSQGMAEVIELMGVPESAIIKETDSANTYENAVDVAKILRVRHIGRILLVTSAMHMPRALALFKHQGVEVIAAPCDFKTLSSSEASDAGSWQGRTINLLPSADSLELTSNAWKEYLGIAIYHAAGLL
jgi:uncharacterized SAM-binding protein YcdF (DUF218 family)